MKHMKKSVALVLALSFSIVQLMAAGSYRIAQKAGHSLLLSNDEHAVVFGEFDRPTSLESMPEAVLSFLSTYDSVDAEDGNAFFQFSNLSEGDGVDPLLGNIEYDQGEPYNDLCPILNGGRAVTGCVATAMAQVMRYWRYPQVGTGTAKYTSSSGEKTYNFADHPFDWNNMLETYTISRLGVTNYNATEASAVATLMLACGASVNMNYDFAGSGSYISEAYLAMRDHFGYSPDIKYYESDDPNWEDWTETLQAQFDRGLPILYGGTGTSGGHAFVLDGYQIAISETTGNPYTLFHVNWGWNGTYNGWFRIRRLQPSDEFENYSNLNQRIVINIYPTGWQAIDQAEAENTTGASKRLQNGQLIIERNNTLYSVQGQRIQ